MHTPPNSQAEWNARYLESDQIWSGNPNVALVREVTGLTPGSALDLGCGEGADAIWLAKHGWAVTGVDISDVALERARKHAASAGVAVDFVLDDLAASPGRFDLVTSFFLHVPEPELRERTLRVAAESVAPGGTLLVVGHSGTSGHTHLRLETAEEVVGLLGLVDGEWQVDVAGEFERPAGVGGHTVDTVVRARRL
jgi:2-polyprenyl-3-methyl-5-hydroxy-6-metoxy-1,4-benzoquinol methylase